jgi:hypothetical protein
MLGIQFRQGNLGKDGLWHLLQGKYIRKTVEKFIGDESHWMIYTPFHPGLLTSLPNVVVLPGGSNKTGAAPSGRKVGSVEGNGVQRWKG